MGKLRICYFFLSHSYEGFQSFNIHMMEFLRSANKIEDVEVIPGFPLIKTNKRLDPELKVFHRVKHMLPRAFKDILGISYNILCLYRAVKVMKKIKPDVVILRNIQFTFYSVFIRKWFKVPLVMEVNTPNTFERINLQQIYFKRISLAIEKWSWHNTDRIYTVSENQKKMITNCGIPGQKIRAIHNGVNPDLYKNLDYTARKSNKKVTCLFAGSFQKFHGLNNIIHAFSPLFDKYSEKFHVNIIGFGETFDQVKKLLQSEKRYSQGISLLGFVEYEKVPLHLVQSDITFLCNFTTYGSPIKLFEYMAAKTAILVPNRNNIKEVLENEKDALFFQAEDMEDFSLKMERLITDKKLREALAGNAYQKVMNNYTWDHNARRVIELAKEAFNEK